MGGLTDKMALCRRWTGALKNPTNTNLCAVINITEKLKLLNVTLIIKLPIQPTFLYTLLY